MVEEAPPRETLELEELNYCYKKPEALYKPVPNMCTVFWLVQSTESFRLSKNCQKWHACPQDCPGSRTQSFFQWLPQQLSSSMNWCVSDDMCGRCEWDSEAIYNHLVDADSWLPVSVWYVWWRCVWLACFESERGLQCWSDPHHVHTSFIRTQRGMPCFIFACLYASFV